MEGPRRAILVKVLTKDSDTEKDNKDEDRFTNKISKLNKKEKKVKKENLKLKKINLKICRVTLNVAKLALITTVLSTIFIFTKYTPAYAVTLNDEFVGYVSNKDEFQEKVNNEILTTEEANVAFVALDSVDYKYEFVDNTVINDDNVISVLKDNSKKIYKVYEVSNGNEDDSVYVNTEDEANALVAELKSNYSKVTDNLSIRTLYLEEPVTDEAIQTAKAKINSDLKASQDEKIEKESKTVNGIYLAVLPVTGGNISSRFGSRESIRNHSHKGLDIATSYGAPIKAVADGTVTHAGWESGYGNLVAISHGNSVETYYGHCSKVLVKVGQTVKAGDIIAKVGSTGNSTGNHLHFEIRINGSQINPQIYLYN